MGESGKFFQIFVNFSGPDKYTVKEDAIYGNEEYKMSPDIDQHCIFPSIEEYGEDFNGRTRSAVNWECRRIEDWEETGINDTYRVIFYNSRLKLMLAFSLSAPLKLMMRDWRRFTAGVGVVKVVH